MSSHPSGDANNGSSSSSSSSSSNSGSSSSDAGVLAVILTGGPSRGTRFRPLSFNQPKPLFPIAGRPLLYHQVESCTKIPNITEIILMGFFEASQFHDFIKEVTAEFRVPVKYLKEPKALGTGGGLHWYRKEIMRSSPGFIFVLHADVCCDFNLLNILEFHKNHPGALATVFGKRVADNVTSNFGCLVASPRSEVLHYVEKPETFVSDVISCGVYVFSPKIFDLLADVHKLKLQDDDIDSDADIISIERDILPSVAGTGSFFVFVTQEPWGQVKVAGAALGANQILLNFYETKHPNMLYRQSPNGPVVKGLVSVDPTAVIHPTAVIGPNVSIGPKVVIEEGVRVKNAIILDNVKIKARACVVNSIIGWGSTIGKWARVEGVATKVSDFLFVTENFVSDKNDIITILGDATVVADEIMIRNCVVLPNKELKASTHGEIIM